ncbi:mannose-1-phosphate guanylyltransferase [Fodinicola acaciae]|uniref:mannose-1-phosphate guanylyltransferase n=1 Tax=Fodinicola acaciae TaxID=2681555 RepID=UPI0013D3168B|nr:mannose-1-phosphate guanylyltransferase [Fodinicola acaciae]
MSFHAVIPAGGSGTRLWPLSRASSPKFLHPLGGSERSLLQSTVDRLLPLTSDILVVTGVAHAAAVARQLPDVPAGNILVEPSPRDSGPAIGLAAAVLARRDPDAVMASFASDHVVVDQAAFVTTIRTAISLAETGSLVTVGMTPTRPETGYGYLRRGGPLAVDGTYVVEEFAEKPALEVARSYVDSGQYLWNASMFVWQAAVFLAEVERELPDLHAGLLEIAAAWDGPSADQVLGRVWPQLKKISVDHGIMEAAAARGRVATVPADFGWSDVGDYDSVATVSAAGDGPVVLGDADQVLTIDSSGAVVVPSSDRLVAVLGMPDTIVVDTPDAVLVCPRSRAQEVKTIVETLKSTGRTDLL